MSGSDNSTPHSSEVYDTQVRKTIPYYDAFHQETLNLLKATHFEPENWLDTGCGTGTLIEKALPQFPNTRFVLVDPSVSMLEAAKNKLANQPRVEFLAACPTENLRLKKGTFDVVTAIQSHHYLPPKQREKATKVCYNLLVEGGIFVTFDNIKPSTPQSIAIGKENWKQFQISQGKDIHAAEAHLQRFGVEYFPLTIVEHIALLKAAGFSVVELLWYSYMQAGIYCIK
ncbi:MAG: class I SAM-dependent methyltransferase [Candidatus Bathyarchaeota archaeon]|nr:class I SAM-dependent methyltransferase [Candidatus Bathyarchaeota archaeon]